MCRSMCHCTCIISTLNLYLLYREVIANYSTSYDGETVIVDGPTEITNYIENYAIGILVNQTIDGKGINSDYTEKAMKNELAEQGNLLFFFSSVAPRTVSAHPSICLYQNSLHCRKRRLSVGGAKRNAASLNSKFGY